MSSGANIPPFSVILTNPGRVSRHDSGARYTEKSTSRTAGRRRSSTQARSAAAAAAARIRAPWGGCRGARVVMRRRHSARCPRPQPQHNRHCNDQERGRHTHQVDAQPVGQRPSGAQHLIVRRGPVQPSLRCARGFWAARGALITTCASHGGGRQTGAPSVCTPTHFQGSAPHRPFTARPRAGQVKPGACARARGGCAGARTMQRRPAAATTTAGAACCIIAFCCCSAIVRARGGDKPQ